jgi:two-component system, LytTR family, response regulator
MIKAIIIDDEKNALDVLSMQLVNYCKEVEVIKLCHGGEEGMKAIKSLTPDLVFLDIEMPKINGFDVLEGTKELNYKVIFTTAYDQFAIKAFRYSAIDYLLKPIDIEELKSAVSKVSKMSKEQSSSLESKLDQLYKHMGINQPRANKTALPIGDAYEMVSFSDIIRCESDSNYTTIFLADNRKVTLSKTLKDVEDGFSQNTFFRIHNSHLINTQFVTKFYKTDGGYVIMKDGKQISISRARKDDFFEFMKKI